MSMYFIKSILSLVMALLAIINIFTIFEVFGRGEKRFDVNKLKKIHRINGLVFISIYFFITYFCLRSIITGQLELSPRSSLHAVFALAVILLLALKISFIEVYRQFYGKVLTIGPVIALIAFGMIGTSGGYYFLVTKFHTDTTFDEIREYKDKGVTKGGEAESAKVKTDPESIRRGKTLFDTKCSFCHDSHSNNVVVGPGLKGILKNQKLPISKRPATPENIRQQLKQPFSKMPSFDKLTDEEVADIIAFLDTL
ncbi:MAG TPA: cytochrome c [Thermodesulfovibrionales bacterium]|nr:cytochrome c [Thermodesulfovibrionales bacterium]